MIVLQAIRGKIVTSMLMIVIPTLVRTTEYVMIWSMIFDVLVLMVLLEFYVKSMSTNVSKELVTMEALVLIKSVAMIANANLVLLGQDAKETLMNVYRIDAPQLEPKNVFNWSTITTVYANQDTRENFVKPKEIFAKEIRVRTEESAPILKTPIIVIVLQVSLAPIANLLDDLATVLHVVMEELVWTRPTDRNLNVCVLPELLAKLANKILETNARIILVNMDIA